MHDNIYPTEIINVIVTRRYPRFFTPIIIEMNGDSYRLKLSPDLAAALCPLAFDPTDVLLLDVKIWQSNFVQYLLSPQSGRWAGKLTQKFQLPPIDNASLLEVLAVRPEFVIH